jgi:hypothetical protein
MAGISWRLEQPVQMPIVAEFCNSLYSRRFSPQEGRRRKPFADFNLRPSPSATATQPASRVRYRNPPRPYARRTPAAANAILPKKGSRREVLALPQNSAVIPIRGPLDASCFLSITCVADFKPLPHNPHVGLRPKPRFVRQSGGCRAPSGFRWRRSPARPRPKKNRHSAPLQIGDGILPHRRTPLRPYFLATPRESCLSARALFRAFDQRAGKRIREMVVNSLAEFGDLRRVRNSTGASPDIFNWMAARCPRVDARRRAQYSPWESPCAESSEGHAAERDTREPKMADSMARNSLPFLVSC